MKALIEKLCLDVVTILNAFDIVTLSARLVGLFLVYDGITMIMQAFVDKFIHGQEPSLFNNEKMGVNEIKWDEYSDKDRNILCISENSMEMGNCDFLNSAWEFGKLVFNE